MTTDEEKAQLAKLLQEIEIPEIKLTERCSDIVKDIQEKFGEQIESDENNDVASVKLYENPYKIDKTLIRDIDQKLQDLYIEGKKAKKELSPSVILTASDPRRPWRINSTRERLLRIDNEIKRHSEKANDMINPLAEEEMKELVNVCREENLNSVTIPICTLRSTVESAKKNLPNFQYRNIDNTTATRILPYAHQTSNI